MHSFAKKFAKSLENRSEADAITFSEHGSQIQWQRETCLKISRFLLVFLTPCLPINGGPTATTKRLTIVPLEGTAFTNLSMNHPFTIPFHGPDTALQILLQNQLWISSPKLLVWSSILCGLWTPENYWRPQRDLVYMDYIYQYNSLKLRNV